MPCQSLSRMQGLITWRKPTAGAPRGAMGPLVSLIGPAWLVCYEALDRCYLLMWRVSFIFTLVVLTGCSAAYTLPPLTTQHPAHPEAMAAPELLQSNTLAYGPADIPSARPTVARAQPGMPGAFSSTQKSPHTVVGEGKVIAVVPASSEIVVAHGEIKGFMDAMTMGYPIAPPSLLKGVRVGDTVRFTIDTEQKAIVKIEKLPQ
jgi:Cu(I)/Ag(I) efflux system periplasmic protein CusF